MNTHHIHLVRVTTDDREHQLWAAATARDQAVDRVLDAIPEGWTACLLEEPMRSSAEAGVNMTLGQVRRLLGVPDASPGAEAPR